MSSPASSATAGAAGTAASTGSTPGGGDATMTSGDATAISGGAGSISGGDTSVPRQAVSTVPPPPAGKMPVIDPTTVAGPEGPPPSSDPGVDPNALQLAVDLDASTPGIQTTREVAVGDVFRVAVVILNVPAGAGLAAFNFELDYDKTKVVAPSFAGGESTDRNPDLNQAALGGGWTCLPAPQGDLDDEGGIQGDGDPATGQAYLSCFTAEGSKTGNLVVATIEMHAVAAGSVTFSLRGVNVGVSDGMEIARCSDSAALVVPCTGATVTVR